MLSFNFVQLSLPQLYGINTVEDIEKYLNKYGDNYFITYENERSIKEKANITYAIKYGGRGNAS